MKELAKFDYIVFSEEFKIFSRGVGDIEKQLNSLPMQTPMAVLEKYRYNFQVDEDQSEDKITEFKLKIQKTQEFLKKVMPIFEIQKKQLKEISLVKEKEMKDLTSVVFQLMNFEDTAFPYYSNEDASKRILTNPKREDLKEQLHKNSVQVKNPYQEAYIWLKGELLDLKGLQDCLQRNDGVQLALNATEQKKKDDLESIEKLHQGKTTLKSLFKNKAQKESKALKMEEGIKVMDKEIEDFKSLIKFLTIYHGNENIPKFLANK